MDYKFDNLLDELENIKKYHSFLFEKFDELQKVAKTNKNELNEIKEENLYLKETVCILKQQLENTDFLLTLEGRNT